MHKKAAMLEDRGVVSVRGADATGFLQGLLTNDVERLEPGEARYAALLTPQGKILFDMIVVRAPGEEPSYFIDCAATQASDLAKRLGFYKLRAKVAIADVSADRAVAAFWGHERPNHRRRSLRRSARSAPGLARDHGPLDRRCGRVGARGRIRGPSHRRRAPKGGLDFAYADAFPHDANFDLLHGVDFDKGCYVGQEVVSRMKHRGTARKRVSASQTGRTRAGARHANHGPRARGRRARVLVGTRGARAAQTRPRRRGGGGGPDIERRRRRRGAGGVNQRLNAPLARPPIDSERVASDMRRSPIGSPALSRPIAQFVSLTPS